MKIDWKKLEPILYILVFCFGLVVRLYNLQSNSLSNYEAGWAVQAFAASSGEAVTVGPNPAYNSLTTLLFFVFGDGVLVARLAGVLVGASVCLIPYFFRKELGQTAALIIAGGLALDPIMVANSRLAGGPMLAMAFGLWAFTAWWYRKSALSGVAAGLALLSGTAILQGAISVGLAYLASTRLRRRPRDEFVDESSVQDDFKLSTFILALAGTLVLTATLFFYIPEGLGGVAEILPTYIRSWFAPIEVPALRMLFAIVLYQPVAALFVLIRLIRRFRSEFSTLDLFMFLWLLASIVLIILNPGRQPTDLIWIVLPLWILAGQELAHYLEIRPSNWLVTSLEAVIIVIILLVGWLNFSALVIDGNNLRWVFVLGLLVIAVVATYLIGLGWNMSDAIQGLVWGLLLGLGLFVIAEVAAVSQPRSSTAIELWQVQPVPGQIENFEKTVGDFSEWNTGRRDSIDTLSALDNKSIFWILRNFPNAQYTSSLGTQVAASILITDQDDPEPEFTIAYRGQEFDWQIRPDWGGILPADWLRWIIYRDSPVKQEKIILWARSDKFPGGELLSVPGLEQPANSGDDNSDLEDSNIR